MRKSTSRTSLVGPLGVATQRIRCGRTVSPCRVLTTVNSDALALTEGAGATGDGATEGEPVPAPAQAPRMPATKTAATRAGTATRRLGHERNANGFISTVLVTAGFVADGVAMGVRHAARRSLINWRRSRGSRRL